MFASARKMKGEKEGSKEIEKSEAEGKVAVGGDSQAGLGDDPLGLFFQQGAGGAVHDQVAVSAPDSHQFRQLLDFTFVMDPRVEAVDDLGVIEDAHE